MIKVGTARELSLFEGMLDRDVYRAVLRIVSKLDETYGADRDVDNSDGGFVLIAGNVEDISTIDRRYVKLDSNRHEAVDIVKCESRPYINAFFLCNNEFGINVFMPIDIAPAALLVNLSKKTR